MSCVCNSGGLVACGVATKHKYISFNVGYRLIVKYDGLETTMLYNKCPQLIVTCAYFFQSQCTHWEERPNYFAANQFHHCDIRCSDDAVAISFSVFVCACVHVRIFECALTVLFDALYSVKSFCTHVCVMM